MKTRNGLPETEGRENEGEELFEIKRAEEKWARAELTRVLPLDTSLSGKESSQTKSCLYIHCRMTDGLTD